MTTPKAEEEYRPYFHRNENRCWWKWGQGYNKSVGLEWVLWDKNGPTFAVSFQRDSYRDCTSYISLFKSTLYLSVDGLLPPRKPDDGEGYTKDKELSVRWSCDYGSLGSLWWNLWTPSMEWSNKTPKWRHGSFDLADFLLGADTYSLEKHEAVKAPIPLPEGSVEAIFTRQTQRWARPRWPFQTVRHSWDVDIPEGMPIPGKGENSWDCDDDAITGTSSNSKTIEGAIAEMVRICLERRTRHGGGLDWLPRDRNAAGDLEPTDDELDQIFGKALMGGSLYGRDSRVRRALFRAGAEWERRQRT